MPDQKPIGKTKKNQSSRLFPNVAKIKKNLNYYFLFVLSPCCLYNVRVYYGTGAVKDNINID